MPKDSRTGTSRNDDSDLHGREEAPPEGEERETGSPDSLGAIPDLLRKALGAGLSGFFLTEATIRKALGDTLPRDWIDFAVDQSERTRAELLERMSFEVGRSIENIDLAAVLEKLLEGRTLEINASVRLGRRDGGVGATKLSMTIEDDGERD